MDVTQHIRLSVIRLSEIGQWVPPIKNWILAVHRTCAKHGSYDDRRSELRLVGLIRLALTVTFEVLFGRFIAGLAWKRIAADYHLSQVGLMPSGLLVLFLSPIIASKGRGKR